MKLSFTTWLCLPVISVLRRLPGLPTEYFICLPTSVYKITAARWVTMLPTGCAQFSNQTYSVYVCITAGWEFHHFRTAMADKQSVLEMSTDLNQLMQPVNPRFYWMLSLWNSQGVYFKSMPVFTVEGYCCNFTTFQLYSALLYIPSKEFYKNFQSHKSTIFNIMN